MSFYKLSDLSGRTAVVTGAAGMIGRNVAGVLMDLGAFVFTVDHPDVETTSANEFFNDNEYKQFKWVNCDLESQDSRVAMISRITNEVGAVDILVNNAAFVASNSLDGWISSFEQQSIESWRRALEVNLTATFHLSQGFSNAMREAKNGSIINLGSIYGTIAPDYNLYEGTDMGNPAAYAVSKAGVIQLTRWLSSTLSPEIRVNAISPGGVFRQQSDIFVKRYIKNTPLGRMATENDLIGIVGFLASDLSAYVTGQNFIIDGGFSA